MISDCDVVTRTAVTAELAITFRVTFMELLPRDEDNEISQFAERCRRAKTKEMVETIIAKKKSGKLLMLF